MVRVTGLEPAHLSALEPKSNVSASFTTPAHIKLSVGFHLRTVTGNKCTEVSQPKSNVSASFTTGAYIYLIFFYLNFSRQQQELNAL